jgi:hypothetical protein
VSECSTAFPARVVTIRPALRSVFVCPDTVAALTPSSLASCVGGALAAGEAQHGGPGVPEQFAGWIAGHLVYQQ